MASYGLRTKASPADEARSAEEERQRQVKEGTARIEDLFGSQFGPSFFDNQRTNYLNYAQPQLADQHADAMRQLVFSLDRRGALDSSSRSALETDLERTRALAETQIKDQANSFRTGAMADVEAARSDLINSLNATGDVQATVTSANNRAKVLSQPQQYNPVGQAFVDFTTLLGQQAAAEKAFSYGAGPKPALVTGLFGASSGAVQNR